MDYATLSTVELRTLVRERGLAKGAAVASARKEDLIALLEGAIASIDTPPLPAPAPVAGGDLADVLAAALSGRIKTGVDAADVKAVVRNELELFVRNDLPEAVKQHAAPVTYHAITIGEAPEVRLEEHTHEAFERVLRLVTLGLPVMLVGPAGTGKTTLAGQVAKAMGRRFSFNSMSAGCSESHIIGRTLPDAAGNWSYKPAPFVVTYRDGGVHLFDEIDAADPNLMVLINAALANGHLSIPFEDMIVNRHADTVIIAAANTYGNGASRQYVGRNALDAATLDRFAVSTVEVGYDRNLESKLVGGILDGRAAEAWLSRCWSIRESIDSASLRRIMSTRTVLNGARRLAAGDTVDAILEDYFTGWTTEERGRVS